MRSAGEDAWLGGPAPAVPHLDAPEDVADSSLSMLALKGSALGKELVEGGQRSLTKRVSFQCKDEHIPELLHSSLVSN